MAGGQPDGPAPGASDDAQSGRVVVAMNAWAARFAEVRRRIVVVGSDIVATERAPDRLAAIDADTAADVLWALADERHAIAALDQYLLNPTAKLVFLLCDGSGTVADTAYFSILRTEWPDVRRGRTGDVRRLACRRQCYRLLGRAL